ncbi:AGC family protein kinase [Histomonas meleagridis]|uniref:AGC family protein kinase n=1 Tax=Histomonas meleagridis TaxID=135588 RepID=UPI003559B344|nr:AGC family protein kinase [Histomonas meleagridis]KAH0799520.1 AGC family protein kinase [Histomonas meleagridis]
MLNKIKSIVTLFLNCDFGSIFDNAVESIPAIQDLLKQEQTPELAKMCTSLLSVALTISHIFTFISYDTNIPEDKLAKVEEERGRSSSYAGGIYQTPNDDNGGRLVLCRICEEYVPVELMEMHSQHCVSAYESECLIVTTDEKLKKLQASIHKLLFRIAWPGERETTIKIQLPMLHAIMLINSARNIPNNYPDGLNILNKIFNSLSNIPIPKDSNSQAYGFLEKAKELIIEKSNAYQSFSEISSKLERTTALSSRNSFAPSYQTTIADFEFLKPISSGSFARVFLARKTRTKDIYAIKVTPKSGLKQKNQVRRILTEKDILLQNNYSILGEHNLYLVMEYIPGGDLFSLLNEFGSFDEQTAKFYTVEIVQALKYLHSNGIIHRDLKPDNILITASGHLKLTDFGLSFYGAVERKLNVDISKSNEKEILGTPDYISPEILLCKQHSYATDFWSLGVVLYEFLLGTPPFHAQTESEIFVNILKCNVNYQALKEEGVSDQCISFIRGLLEIDPEKRCGAKGIDEILSNPWFSDIDWETFDLIEPPYIPPVKNVTDTHNFTQKYKFDVGDDILEDITIAKETMTSANTNSSFLLSAHSSFTQDLQVPMINSDDDDESELSSFPSIALTALTQSTLNIVKKVIPKSFSACGSDLMQKDKETKMFDKKDNKKKFPPRAKRSKSKASNELEKIDFGQLYNCNSLGSD